MFQRYREYFDKLLYGDLSDICVLEVEEKLQPAKEEVVTLIQETLANKLQKNSPTEEITLSL